jgi:hypothetical protein
MCTLVVFGKPNNPTPTNAAKALWTWQRGMVMLAYEDGICTEPPALTSCVVFVHITGVSKSQVEKYIDHLDDRRRNFKIDWTTLPAAVKNALRDNREVTVTLANVKKYIRNLTTNELEG